MLTFLFWLGLYLFVGLVVAVFTLQTLPPYSHHERRGAILHSACVGLTWLPQFVGAVIVFLYVMFVETFWGED